MEDLKKVAEIQKSPVDLNSIMPLLLFKLETYDIALPANKKTQNLKIDCIKTYR